MDCLEARDLIDAYALGAADPEEAYRLEGHIAGCAECAEELNKSRRTTSLLTLAVPIRRAPDRLRRRIMTVAQRNDTLDAPQEPRSLLERLRLSWRPTAGGLAVAGAAALVFASVLQLQLSDLRGDKNQLAQELTQASTEIDQQRQIVAVLSASDSEKVPMQAASLRSDAEGVYNWSRDSRAGFIVCNNFPALPPDQVYQVWFTRSGRAESVATFVPHVDGGCQIPMDYSRLDWRPEGIGISIEPTGGSDNPTQEWFAFAAFERGSRGPGRGWDFSVSAFGY